jgi:hypothetical protein
LWNPAEDSNKQVLTPQQFQAALQAADIRLQVLMDGGAKAHAAL